MILQPLQNRWESSDAAARLKNGPPNDLMPDVEKRILRECLLRLGKTIRG